MKIKLLFPLILISLSASLYGQDDFKIVDLLNKNRSEEEKEMLIIRQDSRIDTLVNRHIIANAHKNGVRGYRIQIYRGGHRTAQDEANRVMAGFINEFPDIPTHLSFDKPNWFKVKVGDFRSREEAALCFYRILQKYPDAYLIRDDIDLENAGR